MNCFQIFAMATTSIGCSVPGCTFQTPRLPERFYPNMVDQLKVKQQHNCINGEMVDDLVGAGWVDGWLGERIDLLRILSTPQIFFLTLMGLVSGSV